MGTARPLVDPRVWVALGLVYVVWGSTYLAIRVTVRTMPPFLGMGARFVVAGLLLGAVVVASSGWSVLRLSRRRLAGAAVLGVLLLLGGNGFVAVAEQEVDSGLAALMVAAVPLWVVLMRVATGERPARWTWVGTLLGFAGIAVLARPGGASGDGATWAVALLVVGPFLWSVGTFLSPRLSGGVDVLAGTAWQMVLGGCALLIAAGATGEWGDVALAEVSASSWWAWVYLTTVGSLVGFTAFVYAVRHAPLSLSSTYAFVNPVVAVALGAVLLDEAVTSAVVVGGGLAVAGVALTVLGEAGRRSAPTPEVEHEPATPAAPAAP